MELFFYFVHFFIWRILQFRNKPSYRPFLNSTFFILILVPWLLCFRYRRNFYRDTCLLFRWPRWPILNWKSPFCSEVQFLMLTLIQSRGSVFRLGLFTILLKSTQVAFNTRIQKFYVTRNGAIFWHLCFSFIDCCQCEKYKHLRRLFFFEPKQVLLGKKAKPKWAFKNALTYQN